MKDPYNATGEYIDWQYRINLAGIFIALTLITFLGLLALSKYLGVL